MSTDFENALIAYAQSLDALGATDAERRRRRVRLRELIDAEFGGSCFAIALMRLVDGCAGEWARNRTGGMHE